MSLQKFDYTNQSVNERDVMGRGKGGVTNLEEQDVTVVTVGMHSLCPQTYLYVHTSQWTRHVIHMYEGCHTYDCVLRHI